jgi:hypothetical protein
MQMAFLRRFRRWLGRKTGIAIGQAGRQGAQAANPPAQPAQPPAPAPAVAPVATTLGQNAGPTGDQLRLHQQAWRQARTYHQVMASNAVVGDSEVPGETVIESIRRQGLLTKYGGTGNSRISRGYAAGSKGKVHVGRNLANRGYSYGDAMLRPVLPRTRTTVHESEDTAPPGELARDPDDRAYGFTTRQDIGPENIVFGSNAELVRQHRSGERDASTILDNLRSHYPPGQPPSDDYLLAVHQAAIDEGYISDEPGDDMEKE